MRAAPARTNNGAIDVANGEIATIESTVTGKGTETISGDSTLEFEKGVSSAETLGDQDIDFTGAGTPHLLKPTSFLRRNFRFRGGRQRRTPGLMGPRERNARYQAGATPYLGRPSTGWTSPASLAHWMAGSSLDKTRTSLIRRTNAMSAVESLRNFNTLRLFSESQCLPKTGIIIMLLL